MRDAIQVAIITVLIIILGLIICFDITCAKIDDNEHKIELLFKALNLEVVEQPSEVLKIKKPTEVKK